MTTDSARTASTVILMSVGVAAAYVVLTTPPLRRLAVVGMRLWLGASLPAYLLSQVGRAWAEAGDARR
jgi:hypothetical protein